MKLNLLQMLFSLAAAEFCCYDTNLTWKDKLCKEKKRGVKTTGIFVLINVPCISEFCLKSPLFPSVIQGSPYLN